MKFNGVVFVLVSFYAVAMEIPIPSRTSVAALRDRIAKIERRGGRSKRPTLPIGVAEIEAHLPDAGLACGTLHEVFAQHNGDRPGALGFAFSVMASALAQRHGHAFFIASYRALRDFGRPFANGLRQLGVDPARLVMVEARSAKDALWALEEVLRSSTQPAFALGAIDGDVDLTASRRLNLAAEAHATPLMVVRSAKTGTNAAATRWVSSALPAARDYAGAFAHPRWRMTLERCRNGRPGCWPIEWTHDTYRFRLAEGVADSAACSEPSLRSAV